MSVSAATLLLPAPDSSWRVWKPRAASPADAVEHLSEFKDTSKPLLIGLPASACRTIAMALPQSDDEVMEQMVMAQLEKRGIKARADVDRNFRWHQLGASGPQALVSVDVLADPFPENLVVNHAFDYTAALRMAHLPEGRLVILEEQGDLVLAASHQGRLLHSHIMGQQPVTPEELAQEITLSKLSLDALPVFGGAQGVTLVGSGWDRAFKDALAAATSLPVEIASQVPPERHLDSKSWTTLLPAAVRESQRAALRRRNALRYALLGAGLYVALGFFAFAYLRFLGQRAQSLASEVDATAPAALAVKQTAERWKALSPALEPPHYPMVQLLDITSVMPPSGIVLRDFEAKTGELDVRGEARDLTTAVTFLEDIKKHKNLGRFTWSMPQPKVEGKVASFHATGKLQP